MARNKYEYTNEAAKQALIATHSGRFLVLDSSEIVNKKGTKKHYLTFDDVDPEPERTEFKRLPVGKLIPAKVNAYIDTNVTDLASAKTVLKQLAQMVLLLAKKQRI